MSGLLAFFSLIDSPAVFHKHTNILPYLGIFMHRYQGCVYQPPPPTMPSNTLAAHVPWAFPSCLFLSQGCKWTKIQWFLGISFTQPRRMRQISHCLIIGHIYRLLCHTHPPRALYVRRPPPPAPPCAPWTFHSRLFFSQSCQWTKIQ